MAPGQQRADGVALTGALQPGQDVGQQAGGGFEDLGAHRAQRPEQRLARIDLRIVLDAANGASAPRWNAGDFFAEKFGGSR